MQANELVKLQASLADHIGEWLKETDTTALDIFLGEHTAELMASSAFNVLLAQKDLSEYLVREGHME